MSREYSELNVAGSLKRNEARISFKIGLLGVAQRDAGRCTTREEFSK